MSFFDEALASAFLVAAVLCLLFAVALYRRSRELEALNECFDTLAEELKTRTEERDMAQRDVKHWYAEARSAQAGQVRLAGAVLTPDGVGETVLTFTPTVKATDVTTHAYRPWTGE